MSWVFIEPLFFFSHSLLFCLVVFFTYFDEHCVSLKNWQQSKEKYLLPFEGWQHIQYSINNPRDKTLHPEHPSQLTPVWNALGINCIPSKYYVLAWKRNFFWTNTNWIYIKLKKEKRKKRKNRKCYYDAKKVMGRESYMCNIRHLLYTIRHTQKSRNYLVTV